LQNHKGFGFGQVHIAQHLVFQFLKRLAALITAESLIAVGSFPNFLASILQL
jgi:hypothetical protein